LWSICYREYVEVRLHQCKAIESLDRTKMTAHQLEGVWGFVGIDGGRWGGEESDEVVREKLKYAK